MLFNQCFVDFVRCDSAFDDLFKRIHKLWASAVVHENVAFYAFVVLQNIHCMMNFILQTNRKLGEIPQKSQANTLLFHFF